jgi:hypothetical protein
MIDSVLARIRTWKVPKSNQERYLYGLHCQHSNKPTAREEFLDVLSKRKFLKCSEVACS